MADRHLADDDESSVADREPSEHSRGRLRRIEHPIRAVVWAVVLVAAITASFLTGRLVQVPDRDQLAQAQRPIQVTAQVEERVVDARTVMVGRVVAGRTQMLNMNSLPEPAVVTRQAVKVGDIIRPGSLIGAISGKPVFALSAPLGLYRDLYTHDSGDDVSSLQQALRGIGADVDVTGRVNWKTTAAITKLFVGKGFPAPTRATVGAGKSSPSGTGEESAASSHPADKPNAQDDPAIPYTSFVPLPVAEATVTQSLPVGAVVAKDTPLVTVQISANTVSFRADAVLAAKLSEGQGVSIQADTQQFAGTIAAISEFTEASEGKIPGRDITVTSSDPKFAELKAGLSVTVLPQAPHEKSLAVPTVAIRQDSEGNYLLIPGATGADTKQPTSQRIPVTINYSGNGWTAISSDLLKPGAEVILR
ncbi:MAG: hypothetical protein B5766_04910 [Candidatus Lumbricidophila eiseniae]|uniref:Peptidoglycan binding-like domain-containing protein n=1 Tax=Candidatus Lumbricidiphila eiseniae TaxID=1969409 RepID=A0A2A6FSD2_9MICO|nr:MAG: hypothetical protein B5766_04910 [Candidatus Lumbricidophila eiseniae]